MPDATSRREFISGGLGLLAASSVVGQTSRPYRIDVHHHFLPPRQAQQISASRQTAPPKWTVELSLDQMDRNGIATSMMSIVQPGSWTGKVEESRSLTRGCNDYAAQVVKDHPGRFGLFAPLPLPDTEGSLREIEYVFDTLKADGIGLMTEYDGKYPGDPAFAPVFEELNRRRAIVYIHPTNPQCCGVLVPGVSISTIEFAADTSRAIASILFSGTAAKFPNIRFIFSHGGGAVPFLVSRFEQVAKERKDSMPNGAVPELRKFYYELAQANHTGALKALLQMAPIEQVLLGSDYPYRQVADVVEGVRNYEFTDAQRQAIERDNAVRMIPRLKS